MCTRKGRSPKGGIYHPTMASATAETSASAGTMDAKPCALGSRSPHRDPLRIRKLVLCRPAIPRGEVIRAAGEGAWNDDRRLDAPTRQFTRVDHSQCIHPGLRSEVRELPPRTRRGPACHRTGSGLCDTADQGSFRRTGAWMWSSQRGHMVFGR